MLYLLAKHKRPVELSWYIVQASGKGRCRARSHPRISYCISGLQVSLESVTYYKLHLLCERLETASLEASWTNVLLSSNYIAMVGLPKSRHKSHSSGPHAIQNV